MDQVVVMSDLHGNVPALEAVIADIQKRSVKEIFILGDLVGKGPCSDQVVDLVRNLDATVIRGNWDESFQMDIQATDFLWYQEQLGEERVEYLTNLPLSAQFYLSGRLVRLFHASADSLFHRVYPWSPVEEQLGMFDNTELVGGKNQSIPDVVGYGDIHHTFIQNFKGGKTLFNCGSVGNPLDLPEASYVILEGDYQSQERSSFSINFIRVPYDIEQAVHEAKVSGMPYIEEFVKELRTARYRGLDHSEK